jgi:hemerythrin-like domain-containing protein
MKITVRTIVLFAALALVVAVALPPSVWAADSTQAAAPKKVGDPFREEHAKVREHVTHWGTMLATLSALPDTEQVATIRHIAKCLNGNVRPHAESEEQVFYPVVDKYAGVGKGDNTITATMRHEHRVIARWTDELTAEAGKPSPDVNAFSRRAQNLIGLLNAHFEQEEEVLLPIVENAMTADQFQKEVMDKMAATGE